MTVTEDIRASAIALYDRFTHDDGMDRRLFMTELARLAGSSAAAGALLAGMAASPAAAALVPADDRRLRARRMDWPLPDGRKMKGYQVEPLHPASAMGSILVIHENRGLTGHIEDVARRLALADYRALAVDFLSPLDGTPTDEDEARAAIGKLDLGQAAADGVATLRMLKALPGANGRVGTIGFCWGGGMVNRIAIAAASSLDAGVAFYGPAPDPSLAPQVEAAMLLHYAGLDERVNQTGLPWAAALKSAGKQVEAIVYPNVNHAFHNDTSTERYDRPAAEQAWKATLRFFGSKLGDRAE